MDAGTRRNAIDPSTWSRGFRANLSALIPIGVFLLLGTLLAVLASIPFDGGALVDALKSAEPADEALPNAQVQIGMLASIVFALPIVAAAWFAPALVVFNNCGAARALATSLRAVAHELEAARRLRACRRPVWRGVPGDRHRADRIGAAAGRGTYRGRADVVPYVFIFITVQTISDYVSYRDIFHPEEGAAPATRPIPASAPDRRTRAARARYAASRRA